MTSVRSMASLTGGLGERNSTSTNTVIPLIVKQSDRGCEFSVRTATKEDPDHAFFLNWSYKDGKGLGHLKDGDGDGKFASSPQISMVNGPNAQDRPTLL
ncbi:hypothetical protein Tco_1384966 [Tanacetum coccineum]